MESDTPGLYLDAEVYDILHAPGTAAEARGLERLVRRWLPAGREPLTWLEPACGTGRYLAALAPRGHRVFGFDRDAGMVRYARRRIGAGRGRIFSAEMTDFASRMGRTRVDVAFNLINTIRHLESDRAMLAHLAEVGRVLRPGGLYLVGLSVSAYGMEFPTEDVWVGRRGGVQVKQVVSYVPPTSGRRERVYSHLVVTRGRVEEHRDSAYWLRCYSGEQWRRIVARSGFTLEAVVNERGDRIDPGPCGYGVYVLRRPALTR